MIDSERRTQLHEFFQATLDKLNRPENLSKSDWRDLDVQSLAALLMVEHGELSGAIERLGIVERGAQTDEARGRLVPAAILDIADECLDVAAFAFFIWDVILRSAPERMEAKT